jgi:hypothetical protein
MATPRVATLAASFVATVATVPGCKSSSGGSGGDKASLSQRGHECFYSVHVDCPPDATCNPPPPIPIECPPEMSDGAAPRGPVRAGSVRVREQLWAFQGKCTFASDYFCPHPAQSQGACDERRTQPVACQPFGDPAAPPGGEAGGHHVAAFVGKRADGTCSRYPAFWCQGSCALPDPEAAPCDAPATTPPVVPPATGASGKP